MCDPMSFLLAALAAWRITHLIAYEDGPFAFVARVRAAAEQVSAGMSCFDCLSLWTPLPFALALAEGAERWLLWLGGSGAVVLLHTLSGGAPALHWEEGGRDHELLRKDEAA